MRGITGYSEERLIGMSFAEMTHPDVTPGEEQMLLDLDGFRAYNDSFGHPAGDALLSRLGRRLAEAVAGRGQAYRGGDELCVLGPAGADGPASLAVAAATALFDYGEGFVITAS